MDRSCARNCAGIGHVIASVHWVHCHHEQADTLYVTMVAEGGDEESMEVLDARTIELGPFDGRADAARIFERGASDLAAAMMKATDTS